jgi:hypothetical protein
VSLKIAVVAAVVMTIFAACAQGGPSSPTGPPSRHPAAPASCGEVPTSTGPAADLVRVRLEAPGTAAAGATIPVAGTIDVLRGGPRIITRPASSKVLVTQGGSVVGVSRSQDTHDIPVVLTAGGSRPAQALPAQVSLTRCTSGGAETGEALVAGTYGLVAVVSYGQDPLQGAAGGAGRTFQLVSEATAVVVR